MKIRYISTSGAALTLGDDLQWIFIRNYQVQAAADLQQVHYFRAPYASSIPRGRLMTQRSFSIDREHATLAKAFLYYEQHVDELFGSGNLEVTDKSGTVIWAPALLQNVRPVELIDLTTIFDYSFLCGAATAINPKLEAS